MVPLQEGGGVHGEITVPTVRLPHEFNEEGLLIAGSAPERCPRCKWTGDLSTFLQDGYAIRDDSVTHPGPAQPECASCQTQTLVFQGITREAQNVADGRLACYGNFLISSRSMFSYNMGSEPVREKHQWWRVFSSSDEPRTMIDTLIKIPRRHWTSSNLLCENSVRFAQACIEDWYANTVYLSQIQTFVWITLVCIQTFAYLSNRIGKALAKLGLVSADKVRFWPEFLLEVGQLSKPPSLQLRVLLTSGALTRY